MRLQVFCGHQDLDADNDNDDEERREYGVNLLGGREDRTSHDNEQLHTPPADGGVSPPWLHDVARLAAHVYSQQIIHFQLLSVVCWNSCRMYLKHTL